tara:strand:- start:96 stop:557 length:462 start_codon:yes stop_codon:yes gene_type:complete
MKKIAALINDLSMSQNTFYLIKEFNKAIDDTDVSVGVFCNRHAIPPIQPLFGCKLASFLISYNGVLISTTLEEAESSLRLPNKSDRYLYLWNLDWLENPVYFSTAMNILRNDKLKVIARSDSHAEIIENFANIKVQGIASDWNMSQLQKIIYG